MQPQTVDIYWDVTALLECLNIEPRGVSTKLVPRVDGIPERIEILYWVSDEVLGEGISLGSISDKLFVRDELVCEMSFIPLRISLIPETRVISVIPIPQTINTDEFHVGELVPDNICSRPVVSCSIYPRYPESLFGVVFKSVEEVSSHEQTRVAILDCDTLIKPIDKSLFVQMKSLKDDGS